MPYGTGNINRLNEVYQATNILELTIPNNHHDKQGRRTMSIRNENISGDLGNGTYLNPVLRGNYADPSIIRVGEDYYMVNTSYQYVPGLIVWHSLDLVNWEPVGAVLHQCNGNVWAPDITYHNGLFYVYFPADGTNWVSYAEDPRGPWSKPVDLGTRFIDPGHVVGPDGKRYLHLSDGHMVQLADDGLSVVGEVKKVYDPWRYPDDWEVEAFSPEGPKLLRKDGYYYMIIAVGGTAGPATSHMVAASRSRTPWGPWEHSPYNPIIRTWSREERWWSQGHGSLIDTPEGRWYMIYHAYEGGFHTLGRHTMLVPIEWTADGWFKVPDGVQPDQPLPMPRQVAEKVHYGMPQQDRFTGLGLHWQRLRDAGRERFRVQDGCLVIDGRMEGEDSPILYMTGHRSYEAEAEVSVSGEAEALFLLYYDKHTYLGLGLNTSGVRHLRNFKSYRRMACPGGRVRLRIRNDNHIVSFYYQGQDGVWVKYDKVVEASGFHHNTFGGFLSLRIGLDAVGSGQAFVHSFSYRPL
jgi:beta-xylosidase